MNRWQADVKAFHKETDIDIGGYPPEIRRPELRAKIIMEEAAETCTALGIDVRYVLEVNRGDDTYDQLAAVELSGQRDLLEAIDGMVDTIVVVLGTAIEMGIDLDPFWDEVQRANMSKAGGEKREDGKQLKPPGWTPPDHAAVIRRAYGVTTT